MHTDFGLAHSLSGYLLLKSWPVDTVQYYLHHQRLVFLLERGDKEGSWT